MHTIKCQQKPHISEISNTHKMVEHKQIKGCLLLAYGKKIRITMEGSSHTVSTSFTGFSDSGHKLPEDKC